jgi:regulator of cell morphogenesis and NO signaling
LNRFKVPAAGLGSDGAMPHDPTPAAGPASAADRPELADLIAHIQARYHEAHRRDLPQLQALARERGPAAAALADHLDGMADALEQHMFKEEMRLFPMMEQGGGSLIGILIDDLEAEHRAHEDNVARLLALTAALPPVPDPAGEADPLHEGIASLVADLAEHVRLEDEELFPRFAAAPRSSAVMP